MVLTGISQTALASPLEQQVSGTARFVFDIYPASPSETTLLGAIVSIFALITFGIYKLFKADFKNPLIFYSFAIINVVIFTIVGSFFGTWLHTYRYGGSEVAIATVAKFWGISGFIIALTGSLIPALVFHDVNNAILSARQHFATQTVTTYVAIFLFISIVLLTFLIIDKFRKAKKEHKSYVGEK